MVRQHHQLNGHEFEQTLEIMKDMLQSMEVTKNRT